MSVVKSVVLSTTWAYMIIFEGQTFVALHLTTCTPNYKIPFDMALPSIHLCDCEESNKFVTLNICTKVRRVLIRVSYVVVLISKGRLHYGGEGLRSVKNAWPRHGYMRQMVDVPEKNINHNPYLINYRSHHQTTTQTTTNTKKIKWPRPTGLAIKLKIKITLHNIGEPTQLQANIQNYNPYLNN
jgi:hypothetical protein